MLSVSFSESINDLVHILMGQEQEALIEDGCVKIQSSHRAFGNGCLVLMMWGV